MAPHSSTLAWKIPWTEEPVRLQENVWTLLSRNSKLRIQQITLKCFIPFLVAVNGFMMLVMTLLTPACQDLRHF